MYSATGLKIPNLRRILFTICQLEAKTKRLFLLPIFFKTVFTKSVVRRHNYFVANLTQTPSRRCVRFPPTSIHRKFFIAAMDMFRL